MSPDPRVARTRARVLDAGWALLNEVGFDGVTVELVSERSGVARSTLYRHWRSMPELLRDAFAHAAVEPGSGDAPDGRTALVAYARAVAAGLTDVWGRAAVSLAASAAVDDAQREVLRVFVQGTRSDLHGVVAAGQASGQLDPAADPEVLVDRLLDLVVAPLFYRYAWTDAPVDPDGAARRAEQAWAALQG